MLLKITKNLLNKMELLLDALDYQVRYEKGNFRGGNCVLKEDKVVVINKFYPFESQVNTLIEVIRNIEVDENKLSKEQLLLLNQLRQVELKL
ncbi:MAG: hypothetical protein EBS07_01460 [Sphingobacteriia bacterium]|nr:hypothetical protein [Sphingobacteriia bacterium]